MEAERASWRKGDEQELDEGLCMGVREGQVGCLSRDLLDLGAGGGGSRCHGFGGSPKLGGMRAKATDTGRQRVSRGAPSVSPSPSQAPLSVSLVISVSGFHCQILTGPRVPSMSLGPRLSLFSTLWSPLRDVSKRQGYWEKPVVGGQEARSGHKDS